jgi:hypothetical protein
MIVSLRGERNAGVASLIPRLWLGLVNGSDSWDDTVLVRLGGKRLEDCEEAEEEVEEATEAWRKGLGP